MATQQLWLLRHGEAVPHDSKPDFERELTARGERQAAAAGEALARLGLEFAACYTSPLLRAAGTAELACERLNVTPEPREELGKELDNDALRDLLRAHDDGDRLLLVGHNPSFEQIVHDLTGARIDFKKGGVAAVRVSGSRGELLALMRPRELESLALSDVPGA
ncbi:MAG TPA: histidine phosphatase family protein [Solirubrobacteraceae bacterium]|jgi:phosphohistidine phosphatase|nr:histidine phosphatase family protein [Solirubrobacteraceae bacterium]